MRECPMAYEHNMGTFSMQIREAKHLTQPAAQIIADLLTLCLPIFILLAC